MEEGPFEETLSVRRVNRWMLGVSLAPALLALALLLAGVTNLSGLIPAFFILSLVGASWVLRRRPAPRSDEQSVRVEADTLRVGARAIPRATLRDARLVPDDGKLFVRVTRRGGPALDLGVRDREEGRRFLRALGFDASQTVAKFRGASRLMSHWSTRTGLVFLAFPALFFGLGFLLESSPALWASGMRAMAFLLVGTVIAMVVPSRIEVGADGVLVRWVGSSTFLPLARIRLVEQSSTGTGKNRQVGVLITMDGGTEVWLPVGSARWADDRAGALVERIREAMETHARGSIGAAAALLGRRERDVRDWIRELRAIGAGANADLRTAPVSPEHLWRIVESHGAEPEERAAAAVALGPSLDEGGKRRLRVAVDAVADERLRVAIDAAVGGEDAALEDALVEVSAGDR